MHTLISILDSVLTVHSPILFRTFYFLTPPSELPPLPAPLKSYWPIHAYTLLQIVVTTIIFITTLTKGGPIFPIMVILLVPFRLLVMKRMWKREYLRYVDAWACRDGTPEDEEDRKNGILPRTSGNDSDDIELGALQRTSGRFGSERGLTRRSSGISHKSKTSDEI
jgi:hypothetical protein